MVNGEIEPLRLSLILLGTFDPGVVTIHLGLKPTRVAVKREGGQGVPKVAKDLWELSRIYQDQFETDRHIEEFLGDLILASEKLHILRGLVEVTGVLSCVFWLDAEGPSPNIYLSETAVAQLKELQLSFNVALYFL